MSQFSAKPASPPVANGEDDGEWVTVWEVRHHPDGKRIRRKDGKPFKFRVSNKARGRRRHRP